MPSLFGFVFEKSTTIGTGDFTLAAQTGFQRFSDAAGTGAPTDVFWYGIRHETASPVEFEEGTGHMSDANTLVRDTVQRSSNADALVNFSAGSKICVIDASSVRQDREIELIGTPITNDLAQFNGTDFVPVALSDLVAFSQIFLSAPQIITPAGSLTLAHGLSVIPSMIVSVLQNTVAEHNYAVGETTPSNSASTSSGNNQGTSLVSDSTNLLLRYGSGTGGGNPVYTVIDRTTGNAESITNSSWNAIFIAMGI